MKRKLLAGLLCLALGIASLTSCDKALSAEEMGQLGAEAFRQENYDEAFEWFSQAANNGDVASQQMLGACYLHGWGTMEDRNEALKWITRAANNGHPYAQQVLNIYNMNGYNLRAAFEYATRSR